MSYPYDHCDRCGVRLVHARIEAEKVRHAPTCKPVRAVLDLEAKLQAAESENARLREALKSARDYIDLLESCQDLYYRVTESEEAVKYYATRKENE